jgi:hypothetical protein
MATATVTRVVAHLAEMVEVDDRVVAGCTCGWTCGGGFDSQEMAYSAIYLHFRCQE